MTIHPCGPLGETHHAHGGAICIADAGMQGWKDGEKIGRVVGESEGLNYSSLYRMYQKRGGTVENTPVLCYLSRDISANSKSPFEDVQYDPKSAADRST